MKILTKHLAPSFNSWHDYYREIIATAKDKGVEHLLADPNSKLDYYHPATDTMFQNTLGWVKIQVLDEIYDQLPTRDELHSNRKRVFMGMKFGDITLRQNFLDFLNALPTK